MMRLEEAIHTLMANGEAVRGLGQAVSDEQEQWKPDAEAWSLHEVLDHLYNEERVDFRMHLRELFHDPPQGWGEGGEEWIRTASLDDALTGFLKEREASLSWLRALENANWDAEARATFGPDNEEVRLRAGDLLASWIAHDYLHLRQLNEIKYAWAEQQVKPYGVEYAGGW